MPLYSAAPLFGLHARLDQTVVARGRLQPSGSVRDVDSPSAGVVSTVLVSDGDGLKPVNLFLSKLQDLQAVARLLTQHLSC